MERKAFSPTLYKKYNDHGIRVASSFLTQLGYNPIVSKEEAYSSHDFLAEKDGRTYKIECEVTEKWYSRGFPYPCMSVPYGKKENQSDFYIRTNPAGTSLVFMPMKDVFKYPVIRKDTSFTRNEPFFNVDRNDITVYYFEDGEWWYDEREEPHS